MVYSVSVLAGAQTWLALLVGILAGLGFNFVTTGGYVFRDLTRKRFAKFTAAYLFIYWVNLGLVTLLSRWMDSVIGIQAVITIPLAIASYLLMSRFVFENPA